MMPLARIERGAMQDEACLVLYLTYEKQNRCSFTMVREERPPCGAGAACNPGLGGSTEFRPQGFWNAHPGLRVTARGGPASGLQRVIYVIYARNVIYGRSVIASEAKQSRETPARAIKFAPPNWIASSLRS
jgi:hypothetical protein